MGLRPVFTELIRHAAQGEVLHNDDTRPKILALTPDVPPDEAAKPLRTGTFTSAIVARVAGQTIALFFTGRRHAGENLAAVLAAQLDEHRVEPNSGLGRAIRYLLTHWEPLTLFLRAPGVPLDNNVAERALKKAILNRKNALFYRTQNGTRVGDLYMSLIHTWELCGVNAFEYLTELQRHTADLATAPGEWLPWTYRETLARAGEPGGPAP